MKRRIILSIALAMTLVFVSLTSSDSMAEARSQFKPVGGSGLIKVGTGQLLRVTVAAGDVNNDGIHVRFVRTGYTEGECDGGGACKLTTTSQTTSAPMQLGPGEALAVDGSDFLIWQRITILSNRQNVRVTSVVFDTSTQRVVSFANTTFDDEAAH